MKIKTVLKFYYRVDEVNALFDGMIENLAMQTDGYESCESIALKMIALIEKKDILGELYAYLDGAIKGAAGGEESVLKRYAAYRGEGMRKGEGKRIKRVLARVRRRLGRLQGFKEALEIIDEWQYYY